MSDSHTSWEEAVLWLRKQPEMTDLVRDCLFDDPLLETAERYYRSTEWEAVRSLANQPAGRVLDVGAGRGTSSYAFARDGWQVTALEPDPSDIVGAGAIRNLATDQDLSIEVVEAWGEALPFDDDSFDLVYCRQVLHHAADLPKLCQEIGRVLRPGGVFLGTREHVVFKDGDLEAFWEKHPLHRLYGGEYAYPLDTYKSAIASGGIQLTNVVNPWASAVNIYPRTTTDLADKIHERVPVVPKWLIAPRLLALAGWRLREPGALYSFVGVKQP